LVNKHFLSFKIKKKSLLKPGIAVLVYNPAWEAETEGFLVQGQPISRKKKKKSKKHSI
jgi:hypothetical protein